MNPRQFLAVTLLSALALLLAGASVQAEPDPFIAGLLDSVRTDNLNMSVLHFSQDFPDEETTTRFTASVQAWPVVQDIFDQLTGLGWETGIQEFTVEHDTLGTFTAWNVIARRRGIGPDALVALGCHLDSIDEYPGGSYDNPESVAPGADDNGSGMAALLEVARILKDQSFYQDIEIVFFGAEEIGQEGSKFYVQQHVDLGTNIAGYFNIDTIGYEADQDWDFVILHDHSSEWLMWMVMAWLADYAPDLAADPWYIPEAWSNSDVYYFWQHGYPALSIWEGHWAFDDHAPFGNDAYDTYNNCISHFGEFLTAMTRFTLCLICEWGYLIEGYTDVAELPQAGDGALAIHPNPFGETTSIRLLPVAGAGATAYEIFDVRGRRLRSLAARGNVPVLWDGRDQRGEKLPAGVYLIRAAGAAGVPAERVVLLR